MTGRYPNTPGHKDGYGSRTSSEAAKSVAPKAPTQKARTLALIAQAPRTAEQVAELTGLHWQIVRARASELRASGLIADSGARGLGALGGKVIVWPATTPLARAASASRADSSEARP